jgi:membrane-associated protease RseP (regulator of RpoE activity)
MLSPTDSALPFNYPSITVFWSRDDWLQRGKLGDDLLQTARVTTRTSGSSGFAIPINRIKSILDDLKAGKEVERGWLGAMMGEKDGKIIFKDLEKGEPAEEAGLKAGDVLVSVDGKRFDEIKAFTSYVTRRKPGEVIKIVVSRDGKECEVSAKLGKRPESKAKVTDDLFSRFTRASKLGGTFSLSVEDASMAEVARKLSDASGASIIVTEPEKIKKKLTVNLRSATVEKALDVICRTLGCQFKKDGDAYVISAK